MEYKLHLLDWGLQDFIPIFEGFTVSAKEAAKIFPKLYNK